MSATNITLNNITYTNGSNSIIVGDIQVNTPAPGAIDIKPVGPQVSTHLILQKGDDVTFKSLLQVSPVRDFEITIYDQHGHTSCRYGAGRKDNSSGNVKITESKDLLSNIDFPKVESGQTYLVISHYDGLDQLSVPESKKDLVVQDLTLLQQKVNTKEVVLVITSEIYQEIAKLGVNLDDYFKQVLSNTGIKLVKYLVEYLVGKSISGSKPSFQGMLKFDYEAESASEEINVVMARFAKYDLNSGVSATIRRNGRIQINTDSKSSRSRFFIMLKHSGDCKFKLSEEVTGTQFEIVNRTSENIPDITDENFNDLMDGLSFFEKLNAKKDHESISKFVSSNLEAAGRYMFSSPLAQFDELESKSDLSSMIIEYGASLRSQIYYQLSSIANTSMNQKVRPRARVLFGNNELVPAVSSFAPNYQSTADFARGYTESLAVSAGIPVPRFSSTGDNN